jgi:hypothetical protein
MNMATLAELIADLASARDQMRAAVEGAAAIWEDAVLPPEGEEVNPGASGDAWTPQHTARHAIGAAAFFTSFAATGIGIEFEYVRPEIETPEDAARAVDKVFTDVDSVIARASDDSLTLEAPVGDGQIMYAATKGVEVKKNVEGALRMVALHTADHAEQIARGSD